MCSPLGVLMKIDNASIEPIKTKLNFRNWHSVFLPPIAVHLDGKESVSK